jgi:hypothetical protein
MDKVRTRFGIVLIRRCRCDGQAGHVFADDLLVDAEWDGNVEMVKLLIWPPV